MDVNALRRRLRQAGYHRAALALADAVSPPVTLPDRGCSVMVDVDPIGMLVAHHVDGSGSILVCSEAEVYHVRPLRARTAPRGERIDMRVAPERRARWLEAAARRSCTLTELIERAVDGMVEADGGT